MDLVLLLLRLLLAAALYLFLGAVLFLLWRSLRRADELGRVESRRYGRLLVVGVDTDPEDMEEGLAIGTSFPLQPVTSLGRSPVNTVTIPDAYASAEHALLVLRGGQWWLEDRGSRNGTALNAVTVDGPTVVSTGDIVGIGRVLLKLEIGEP
jgi:pSer/pThr/pTyr-binding forkhead associated (FHA) protein